jgi:hypothetical protein
VNAMSDDIDDHVIGEKQQVTLGCKEMVVKPLSM